LTTVRAIRRAPAAARPVIGDHRLDASLAHNSWPASSASVSALKRLTDTTAGTPKPQILEMALQIGEALRRRRHSPPSAPSAAYRQHLSARTVATTTAAAGCPACDI
jgi:hypothetical protein